MNHKNFVIEIGNEPLQPQARIPNERVGIVPQDPVVVREHLQDGEDFACGFGLNVTSDGTYLKISSKKPKFDGNK